MTNTVLRIPDDLYEKVKKIAEREHRSINSQLLHIISEYIEEYEKSQES